MMLVLAAVACGLPAQTGGPAATGANLPATLAVEPTPTAEPEPPPPPSDFAAVLDAEVAAGEITYEDGLIRLLRSFLGDPEVTLPAAYAEVVTTEGNGIVERAEDYIAGGMDEAAKAEMNRLLDLIVPTIEQLEAYSRPAEGSFGGPGLAQPPVPLDCANLWLAGFPLVGVTTYPCFAYVRSTVSGAATYTVYFPSTWTLDDPQRQWLERARLAVDDSLSAYRIYGAFDDISVIFSLLPGARADFLATTHHYLRDHRETCPVLIYPLALGLGEDEFKQTIAHEIFHCFEFRNLPGQMQVDHDINMWWSEATAEYFSNVVYPAVDYEHRWVDTFDYNSKNTPLHRMGYENFGFFQFLATRWGDNAVITFLESMPDSGGSAEQLEELASWPGMQEVFHKFGQDYLDSLIADSGGGTIPFSPMNEQVFNIPRGSFDEEITPQTFVLERRLLVFAEDTRFDVRAEQTEGEGRDSSTLNGRGQWRPLPATVNTACGENQYLLLVTSAVAGGETPLTFTLETTGEEVDPEVECDACLVGTWTLDNGTYFTHLGGLWPLVVADLSSFGLDTGGAQVQLTNVYGGMQITFYEDGTADGVQLDWGYAGEATGEDGTVHSKMVYNGTGEALWRIETDEAADQNYVFFDDGSFSLSGQMTFEVFPLRPVFFGESNDSVFLSSPQPYLCDATALTYYADDPLGPVVFYREIFESPEP